MGTCLVIIKKSYAGQSFVNTHAINLSETPGPMSVAEMTALLAVPFLDISGGLLEQDPGSALWRLLNFEQRIYSTLVRFERVLITDRTNYQPGPDVEQAFKGYTLNFNGLTNISTPTTLDAGDHVLSITRQASAVGAQDGEIEYRMLLNKSDFVPAGERLLSWASDQEREAWGTRIENALALSGLDTMFGNQEPNNPTYVIPRYTDLNNTTSDGNIVGYYNCSGFAVYGPRHRQVRGGRRRKKPTTP